MSNEAIRHILKWNLIGLIIGNCLWFTYSFVHKDCNPGYGFGCNFPTTCCQYDKCETTIYNPCKEMDKVTLE